MERFAKSSAIMMLALGAEAWAAEEGVAACPTMPASLEFTSVIPPPNYIYDKSVTSIQYMMRENGHVFAGLDGSWTLGVTMAKPNFTLDGEVEEIGTDEGSCVRLATIKASVGYAAMEVYIGSDFKPGTCAFKATYDHEYQHVNINTYTMEEFAKAVRPTLERLAAAETARRGGEAVVDREAFLAPYRAALEKAVEEFARIQRSRHAALDTPQNYARTQAQCNDWNQSYTWTKTTPVQQAPAQPMALPRPGQRTPARPGGRPNGR